MAFRDSGVTTASHAMIRTNTRGSSGVPRVRVRVSDAIDVNGSAQASNCRDDGRFATGKNTPQKRNIGKISRY